MAATPSHAPDGLRYLSADRVQSPIGSLAECRVCTEDAKALGTIDGVLIDPLSRRVTYLVLDAPGLVHRKYLVAFDDGAVVQGHPKMLRMAARRRDLVLQAFAPRSVAELSEDELLAPAFSRDAA